MPTQINFNLAQSVRQSHLNFPSLSVVHCYKKLLPCTTDARESCIFVIAYLPNAQMISINTNKKKKKQIKIFNRIQIFFLPTNKNQRL